MKNPEVLSQKLYWSCWSRIQAVQSASPARRQPFNFNAIDQGSQTVASRPKSGSRSHLKWIANFTFKVFVHWNDHITRVCDLYVWVAPNPENCQVGPGVNKIGNPCYTVFWSTVRMTSTDVTVVCSIPACCYALSDKLYYCFEQYRSAAWQLLLKLIVLQLCDLYHIVKH